MKKRQTLYIYLLSYISLLFLGSIFIFFCQSFIISVLNKDIRNNQSSSFCQMENIVSTESNRLFRMNYQLTSANSNLVYDLLMDHSPVTDQKIINELAGYAKTNSMVYSIAYLKKNGTMVYTSEGILPEDIFFSSMYDFGNDVSEDDIKAFTTHTVLSARAGEEHYAAFFYPSTTSSNIPNSIIIIFLKSSELSNLLTSGTDTNMTYVLLDSQKNVVAQNRTLDDMEQLIMQLRTTGDDNIFARKILQYTCYLSSSDYSPLYLAVFFNDEINLIPLQKLQTNFFIIYTVFLTLGIIIIIYCMKMTYVPVKKLFDYSRNLVSDLDDSVEITTLQDVIDQLAFQNKNLSQVIRNDRSLRDSFLFSLLKGKNISPADIEKIGGHLEIHLQKEYYSVMAINVSYSEDSGFSIDTLETLLCQFDCVNAECYCRELFDRNQYVCIFGVDTLDMPRFSSIINSIIESAAARYDASLFFAMSNFYDSIQMISTAYLEATMAIHEIFLSGSRHLILFQNIQSIAYSTQYPIEEIQNLKNIINKGDLPAIDNAMTAFFNHIGDDTMPSIYAKHICRNIAYLIVSRYHEILIKSDSEVDYLQIYYINSLENFQNYFKIIINEIEKNIAPTEPKEDLPILEQVLHYINQNYDNCNFSIQETASLHHLNSSYLSQLFKKQMNTTLHDYIADLRIKKAKQLLEVTTMPIDMIAEEVGYYNTSSFIRRFKQISGITPGEYRKNHNNTV